MAVQTLIIAEKRSAADTLASWLSRTKHLALRKGPGFHELGPYTITWMRGHLLENAEPHLYDPRYKSWSLADLPIVPSVWKLTAREGASAQVKLLKELIGEAREIVGFTDPDVEGQLLQDEFLLWARAKAPTKRLWAGALDDASLARAWASMRPNSDYEGVYWQGLSRSHADWLIGINLTRACTISGRAAGADSVLSVGRVQTPTLYLVVDLERQIRAFVPHDYYTPTISLAASPEFSAVWAPDKTDSRLDPEGRLRDKSTGDNLVAAAKRAKHATVAEVTANKVREQPPLLFSLSTLQAYCSGRLGLGVKETLDVAQALYDAKLTSYPRTDCEYLPSSQHSEAPEIVRDLAHHPALAAAAVKLDLSRKSRAFNDKKISAHHAIVPRPITAAQLAGLSGKARAVYEAIAQRYLVQFFPDAEALATEILLECAGEPYKVRGKVYTSRGWRDAFSASEAEDEEECAVLPEVKVGERLSLTGAELKASTTKPPKRFTQGTLLAAMKNIHRYVADPKLKAVLRENAGIGTEATRAGIIEELVRRGFMSSRKNKIEPTDLGISLIDTLPAQITRPDMTALWQQTMEDIKDTGKPGYERFMTAQKTWLATLLASAPTWFAGRVIPGSGRKSTKSKVTVEPSAFSCTRCKTGMLARIKGKYGWFFACQDPACKTIFKDVDGKPVEKTSAPAGALTIDGVASGSTCPTCKKGTLQVRVCGPHTKVPGAKFLSCSNFFAKGRAKCTYSLWPKR
jgi:DNA topoisomerase-3